jgi:hypothetical protein
MAPAAENHDRGDDALRHAGEVTGGRADEQRRPRQ